MMVFLTKKSQGDPSQIIHVKKAVSLKLLICQLEIFTMQIMLQLCLINYVFSLTGRGVLQPHTVI